MAETTERTIAKAIECDGVGLHSGARVQVRLVPAEQGGRVFHTTCGRSIPARLDAVHSDARAGRTVPRT